jgi:hypothetical protein
VLDFMKKKTIFYCLKNIENEGTKIEKKKNGKYLKKNKIIVSMNFYQNFTFVFLQISFLVNLV